ncbi:hypothetical protein K0U83_05445 [bacterium]|nr:hypothetical protein [bacterium]
MSQQIDLTRTEETYGDLLLGGVFTRYESDGELYVTTFDVRDVDGEPFSQITGALILSSEEVERLRDWLNSLDAAADSASEMFPGVNKALAGLGIREVPGD